MSVIETIKNILIPAVKGEFEKSCVETVEYSLYHEPVDLSEVTPVPYDPANKRIRVIGPIITRY